MPNHGKGGRKPERGEAKRSSVAVRTTSEIKSALEAAALDNERSVTQEVEARLEASLALDKPKKSAATMRLLAKIAEDIEQAEIEAGAPWDRDLTAWAAVREALATGAIERATTAWRTLPTSCERRFAKATTRDAATPNFWSRWASGNPSSRTRSGHCHN